MLFSDWIKDIYERRQRQLSHSVEQHLIYRAQGSTEDLKLILDLEEDLTFQVKPGTKETKHGVV